MIAIAPMPTSDKSQLRHHMRERRLALPLETAREAAERAARVLLALPAILAARVVALYAAFRGELSTEPVARALRGRGVTVCYPRVARPDRLLAFVEVPDESLLVVNRLGIPEPPERLPIVAPSVIDVIVVPGLAFDPLGGRLGWGGAYYDTTLAAAQRALRVGYAFELQIVPRVPVSGSDARVDVLVTEEGARPTCARPSATTP
jgi:5-formyltetrahydrofolate cyclo-ligase